MDRHFATGLAPFEAAHFQARRVVKPNAGA